MYCEHIVGQCNSIEATLFQTIDNEYWLHNNSGSGFIITLHNRRTYLASLTLDGRCDAALLLKLTLIYVLSNKKDNWQDCLQIINGAMISPGADKGHVLSAKR